MPQIAHLSDLHLQSGVPERQAQVEPILQAINDRKPDLVVISGDVTDDGWDSIDELKWAKAWLDERIESEWFAVPGNHDVGNFVSLSKGVIHLQKVEKWNEVFGCQIERDVGIWTLLGINSMQFGSELATRVREHEWLFSLNERIAGRPLAVFLHSPLFIENCAEVSIPATEYWLGSPAGREVSWKQLNRCQSKLICSGHVHQTRLTQVDGVQIAWAPPASGTWVHAPGLPNPPMPEKTGFFLHTLHDDGRVESELIECAPMLKCIEFNPWP